MISVPCGHGCYTLLYDIRCADGIRFAYDGNGYYIILASKYIMRLLPYIISRKRYIIMFKKLVPII